MGWVTSGQAVRSAMTANGVGRQCLGNALPRYVFVGARLGKEAACGVCETGEGSSLLAGARLGTDEACVTRSIKATLSHVRVYD